MEYRKKIFYYLLLGLLLRVLIMPFFVHWDLPAIYEMAHYISFHGVKDIYTYIYNNYNHWAAVYPPLTFFSFTSYLWLLKPLMPLFDVTSHFNLNSGLYPGWVTGSQAFRYLFLLKLPNLFFDLLLGLLLMSFFNNRDDKVKALKLYLFCPITLYINFVFGQFDIIPTFFTFLAFYFFQKQKPEKGFFSLGIAIALKNYPLIMLPIALIFLGKKITRIIKYSIICLGPLLLSVIPYYRIFAFKESVIYSDTSKFLFKNKIINSGIDALIPFFVGYGIIIIFALITSRKTENQESKLMLFSSVTLISFFSFVYFHPQWLVWLIPFLIIYLVKFNELIYSYWAIIMLYIPYLFHFSSSTTWRLLDVINLNLFHYLKSPKQLIFQVYNADNLLDLSRSLLTAALLSSAIIIIKNQRLSYEDN